MIIGGDTFVTAATVLGPEWLLNIANSAIPQINDYLTINRSSPVISHELPRTHSFIQSNLVDLSNYVRSACLGFYFFPIIILLVSYINIINY
jgi:hypothetical protein